MELLIEKTLKRSVKKIKIDHNIPKDVEIKFSRASPSLRLDLLQRILRLDIDIYTIVVKKTNVNIHLRNDKNILYNYIVNLLLVPYLENIRPVDIRLIADLRISRVAKGMRFADYLKYKLYYEKALYDIDLDILFYDSLRSYGLQDVDFISGSIFKTYERRDKQYYELTKSRICMEKKLFW